MTGNAAARLAQLPPYLFVEIDRRKAAAIAGGRDVIDFGVGDPDRPTPGFIVDRLSEAARDPTNHTYSPSIGTPEFRKAVAQFFARRFGVSLDHHSEVLGLIGAKEGIGHLPTALVDPGMTVLCPEPGYPVFVSGTIFAGGRVYIMPLGEAGNWLPQLSDIPGDVLRSARLMFLNYPNNPTTACAPLSFFEEVVGFAKDHNIVVAHDAAYGETFFGDPPPSILQVDGARNVAIEFHSFSKTFNMTGWRLAFAVGNSAVLAALATVKSNLDSGVFKAVQQAGIAALEGYDRPEIREQIATYRRRRDALVLGLRQAGWTATMPEATIYAWVKCPNGWDSMSAARRLLDDADVLAIPGAGMGECGEGFLRFALTVDEMRIGEAVRRIARLQW